MATKSHDLELHESETSSTRRTQTVTGSHRFKVEGYSFDKGMGIGKFVTSPTFTVGGYDWAILYYPDGSKQEYKDYLSFLELKSEATDVKVELNFSLLIDNRRPSEMKVLKPAIFKGGTTWGYGKFIERKTFEKSEYLKDNSFVIICDIMVIKPHCFESMQFVPVMVPPSNLDEQLHYLLKSGETRDVTFEIGGEFFKAHKLILGARSRVFHAQLFGQMKEKQADHIKLDNIEVEVFRVFLCFLYSDSVSKLEESINDSKQEEMFIYQHLLVAADRYEIERLKLICENKLSLNIEVKNYATTLTSSTIALSLKLRASRF